MTDSGNQFLQYEPLLWRVQARLVRDGYVIEPQDARDFIHDFYLEWDGLLQRYQSVQGAFEPYLVTAFYQFCRRRVFKLEKLKNQTAELEEAAELPAPTPPAEESIDQMRQMRQLERLIANLPEEARSVLHDFLGAPAHGERALANKHGLSRYRLREMLAELVGRIALQMTEAPYDSLDAKLVRGVWLEGRPARAVAAMHGVTVAQLHAAKNRFSQALLNAVRTADQPSPIRRKNMDIRELLKRVILSPDEASMAQLRLRSAEVRQALDDDPNFDFTAEELARLHEHPEVLAAIYQALGGTAASAEASVAALDAVRDAHTAIYQAWEVLADRLDIERWEWDAALGRLAVRDDGLRQYLASQMPASADYPAARRLLRYGLTPTMLYEAWDNIRLLFDRVSWRAEPQHDAGPGVMLKCLGGRRVSVALARIERQVASARDLEFNAEGGRAAVLTAWTLTLLERHPFLIAGYEYDAAAPAFRQLHGDTTLRPLSFGELAARWCRQAQGARGHQKTPLIEAETYSGSSI